jgi:hypothetical protein
VPTVACAQGPPGRAALCPAGRAGMRDQVGAVGTLLLIREGM